jgi:carbamoyltransferase
MKILGIHNGHDAAFSVVENGIPTLHVELERYTRIKEGRVPNVWEWMIENNFNFDDIDYFICHDRIGFNDAIARPENIKNKLPIPNLSEQANDSRLKPYLHYEDKQMITIGHHTAHAANAFYSSNLEESLIITIDGGGFEVKSEHYPSGRGTGRTAFRGIGKKIEPIYMGYGDPWNTPVWSGESRDDDGHKINFTPEDSWEHDPMESIFIGQIWSHYTRDVFGLHAGPPHGHQAGTVMALAALGKPKFLKAMYPHPMYFKNFATQLVQQGDDQTKYDIAASLQLWTEQHTFSYIEQIIEHEKENTDGKHLKNLCVSGGVVLNSVMTGKLYDRFGFENIYVCPVPYDAGLCIGSSQYLYHHILDNNRIKWNDNSPTYLGEIYDENIINKTLSEFDNRIVTQKVTDDDVIDLLDKQNIVSVFGGGSESGRRAHGNRSILADPRSLEMKDMINEKVKHRQWFRPFAPSILREEVKNWFQKDIDSPYMSFVIPFKDEETMNKVPAVAHFDGTARLQTVTKNDNEWYYNFLSKWFNKSGVPILLNTSFNDREPIVETPEHAINCYLGTNIDYLYFRESGVLVSKSEKETLDLDKLNDLVKLEVTGIDNPKFKIMKPGVKQHLDRDYTYDIIPDELLHGYLFQNVHRTLKGTEFKFELSKPTDVYFIFHKDYDGGYQEIIPNLDGWTLCDEAPQYDVFRPIHKDPTHGMGLVMYKLEAKQGVYEIPQSTDEQWSCISMVFKER